MPKVAIATEDDYVKFKKFLRFFVRQAEINADNGKVDKPTMNKKQNGEDNPRFWRYYGLDPDFNQIAGIDFTIRFFKNRVFGGKRSTYINVGIFNIVGEFVNKKIIALRNSIVDVPGVNLKNDFKEKCEEWNKMLQSHPPYSIKDLGIDKDNNDPPNDTLKSMLDEYLKIYPEFYERYRIQS